jgi:hypothetical protein
MNTPLHSTSEFVRKLTILCIVTIITATASAKTGKFEPDGKKAPRTDSAVEIRFEFFPTGSYDDSVSPIFMVIGRDGNAHALRYGLRDQTKNVAAYEGKLAAADVPRLFARIHEAFRLPKYRNDYDRRLVYEGDGFYLAIRSHNGKVKEMFGNLETRPDEVRSLFADLRESWKNLKEVTAEYAYLTSRPIEKDRLRLLRKKYGVDLTRIESLPAALQSLLIPVVTQSLNFYPLTQPQYDQLRAGKLAITYKDKGYELSLFPSAKEAELRK